MMYRGITALTALAALLATPALPAQELAQAVTKNREMVVTANPLATAAGEEILKLGGTAADAMVAVQTVLGLVEPQSSGLGGGAFVVYYDAVSGTTTTIDARGKTALLTNEELGKIQIVFSPVLRRTLSPANRLSVGTGR